MRKLELAKQSRMQFWTAHQQQRHYRNCDPKHPRDSAVDPVPSTFSPRSAKALGPSSVPLEWCERLGAWSLVVAGGLGPGEHHVLS